MKESELLWFIHKTCEMGVSGLNDVKNSIKDDRLRNAAESQIREYESITARAGQLLRQAGLEPKGPGAMSKAMAGIMSKAKLTITPTDSKIAEMIIQGNTMGITKCVKHLNDFGNGDSGVRKLAEKLISTQQANVEQIKPFL